MGQIKNISSEQRKKYREQARVRAGSKIRKLVIENKLSKMWTLTYALDQDDRTQAKKDFEYFIKRLSYYLKRKINYVAVMEIQKEREEKTGKKVLHFHLALEGYYIDKHKLQEIWKHGVVWYSKYKDGKPIRGKNSVGGYLSKYLKKDMEENIELLGKKMYLNSQGLKLPKTGHLIMNDKEEKDLKKSCKQYQITEDIKSYEIDTGRIPTSGKILYVGEDELLPVI